MKSALITEIQNNALPSYGFTLKPVCGPDVLFTDVPAVNKWWKTASTFQNSQSPNKCQSPTWSLEISQLRWSVTDFQDPITCCFFTPAVSSHKLPVFESFHGMIKQPKTNHDIISRKTFFPGKLCLQMCKLLNNIITSQFVHLYLYKHYSLWFSHMYFKHIQQFFVA